MDCQKCGYALSAFEKDCPRCRRVAAEEFAKSPAAVWPPAIQPQVAPQAAVPAASFRVPLLAPKEVDNSSGEERGGPPEIEDLHWNWGAFFCGWLWCFFHRAAGFGAGIIAAGFFLLAFTLFILPAGYALPAELMAVVVFGLCCYLGMHGHRMAWERRRFHGGVPQYLAVQRAWAVGGAASFGVTVAFCVTLSVLFMAAFRAYEARRQAVKPAPVSTAAPTGPAPVIMRPDQPQPIQRPLLPPGNSYGPGGYQPGQGGYPHQFNPNSRGPMYRRDFEPQSQPPTEQPSQPQPPQQFPVQTIPAPNQAPPASGPSSVPSQPQPSVQSQPVPQAPSPAPITAPSQTGTPPASGAGQ